MTPNVENGQMLSALFSGDNDGEPRDSSRAVATDGRGYLPTFTYRA